ncbi:MAG TPA: TetR/AcrR family transcriptional regulator [Candidatus Kryptonia bacterium]|nr:TetR/AcrR family transcriptional regulator [Candidatus Kryptonia bacterium]
MAVKTLPSRETCRLMALRAGVEVFARDGLHAATMDEVARRAGFTKPILYRHFASKEDLFHAVVEAECEQLVQHLFAAYAQTLELPLLELFRAGTAAFFDYAKKHPHGFRLLFLTSSHRSSTVAAKVEATAERIIERVAEMTRHRLRQYGSPAGQVADIFATMEVGLIAAVARQFANEPTWDEEAVINLIAEFLSAGATNLPRQVLVQADKPAVETRPEPVRLRQAKSAKSSRR